MDEKNVPYIVYESTMARFERTVKRLIVALVVAIVLLFANNVIWLCEWNQYDYSDVTIDSQDGGNANYIGASGVINNGEGESSKEGTQE